MGSGRWAAGLCLLWLFFAAACLPALPGGRARAPNASVPARYGAQDEAPSSAQVRWSEFFTDARLRALIEAALKNNQEINIVSLELNIAENEVMARRGEYLPKVAVRVGAGIEKVGQYTSQGASDEAHGVPQHLPEFPQSPTTRQVAVRASSGLPPSTVPEQARSRRLRRLGLQVRFRDPCRHLVMVRLGRCDGQDRFGKLVRHGSFAPAVGGGAPVRRLDDQKQHRGTDRMADLFQPRH